MKNPLLFTKDGPALTDPNDSVFVSEAKNDSNMVEQSRCLRTTSCNFQRRQIGSSYT
jgi:hypothetical protein